MLYCAHIALICFVRVAEQTLTFTFRTTELGSYFYDFFMGSSLLRTTHTPLPGITYAATFTKILL